ncbi:hypothetical protein G7Y89_g7853 [Cudoniella acicularis]|uniref:Uncharacterized protein n=1 Tax=Cudoniella acicularis TaxID=354080 RepID=A0A8H4RJQ8_9HELO|nr:hypothetical protein G7Y89_g7853 [Cudoniella acicularis]
MRGSATYITVRFGRACPGCRSAPSCTQANSKQAPSRTLSAFEPSRPDAAPVRFLFGPWPRIPSGLGLLILDRVRGVYGAEIRRSLNSHSDSDQPRTSTLLFLSKPNHRGFYAAPKHRRHRQPSPAIAITSGGPRRRRTHGRKNQQAARALESWIPGPMQSALIQSRSHIRSSNGMRKKTEFKQLPRGYAEVLENTQYALIATVQKLYTMVRNNESWDLGEPELNDRGQPVIHDIASKLGCIRPSPDLPYAFPEGAEDFAELQAQLQTARSETNPEDTASRKHSQDSSYSPPLDRTDRASSSESDHSNLSNEYNQMLWSQRQAAGKSTNIKSSPQSTRPAPLNFNQRPSFDEEVVKQARVSIDTARSVPSPIYTDYQMESPMVRNSSPFSPWSAGDEFLGPAHALDLTAHYMRQQQSIPRSSPLNRAQNMNNLDQAEFLKNMQFNDGLNFTDGTIRPNMLDCSTGLELFDQMDVMYPTDYEAQLSMA